MQSFNRLVLPELMSQCSKDSISGRTNTMSTPKIAATSPIAVTLEEGKRYAFCVCGESNEQPFCDGSHKGTGFAPKVFTAEKSGEAYLCRCKHTGNAPYCDGSHSRLDV